MPKASILRILIVLGYLTLLGQSAKASKSRKTKSFPLWEDTRKYMISRDSSQKDDKTYLWKASDESDPGQQMVRDIVDIIYFKQNPPRESCKSKRLLVLQMTSTSFEGTGSLLKQQMLSTAIAMHSNRTMVWGLGFPFIFEHTKDIWDGPNNDQVKVNSETLDCRQDDASGGPWGCFFQPVSSCSLEDTSRGELIELSEHPYNESARLMLSEVRKGVALYHPPIGLFEYIWSFREYSNEVKQSLLDRQAHIWASAVAAYVFRIKKNLENSFERRFNNIFEHGKSSVWGLHVRHGDLKALTNIYAYKEVFDFEEYFDRAISMSHQLKFTPDKLFVGTDSVEADDLNEIFAKYMKIKAKAAGRKKNTKPSKKNGKGKPSSTKKKVEISKGFDDDDDDTEDDNDDGEDYDDDDEEEEDDEDDESEEEDDDDDSEDDEEDDTYGEDEDEDEDEDEYGDDSISDSPIIAGIEKRRKEQSAKYSGFYGGKMPAIVTITNADRYRTEHGSHTVAANGGCLRDENYDQKGMRCSLNYEAIVQYQMMEEHAAQTRSMRLMRVLLESIEDIYILSRSDALIGSGSSHFSTGVALLVWASKGAKNPTGIVSFLDQETIEIGFTPTAFLHGMNLMNGTNAVNTASLSAGKQRWRLHHDNFITSLYGKEEEYPVKKLKAFKTKFSIDPFEQRSIMHMKNGLPHVLDELFYIEAKSWQGKPYQPFLNGHCPGPIMKGEDPIEYATLCVNLGVDHLNASHNGQAIQCWRDAHRAIKEKYKSKKPNKQVENILSVLRDNLGYVRVKRYAEMAINENRNSREYYEYSEKYMQKPFDGVSPKSSNHPDNVKTTSKNDMRSPDGNKLYSLEDVNEEILELEDKLKVMKNLREKLVAAHYMHLNGQLDEYVREQNIQTRALEY